MRRVARAAARKVLASRRRSAVAVLFIALLVAGLVYGGLVWYDNLFHVSTDDAYVTAHIAPVASRITGTVAEVLVDDNREVKAGEVLVRLDRRDHETALAQARAAVEMARADLANATLNVPLTAESTRALLQQAAAALAGAGHGAEMTAHDLDERRGDLAARQAAVAAAEAAVRAAAADADRTRQDRDRLAALFASQLVARQDLDHAEAALKAAQATLDGARERLAQARSDVTRAEAAVRTQQAAIEQARRRIDEARAAAANAEVQRQQVRIREAQVDTARGRLAQALAALEQAQLNLEYTVVRAPVTGRITKKSVEPGQVLQPGQVLLAVVDTQDVWVVANYKETQLTHVRPGQPATLTVDTYPGVVIRARVDSIQAGSGTVFSLLPSENASGNFVKVVQRVPVKLVIDGHDARLHPLVPGMSVVPSIDIRSHR